MRVLGPCVLVACTATSCLPGSRQVEALSPAVAEERGSPVLPSLQQVRLDCRAPGHPISPLIYGVGHDDDFNYPWRLGATVRRWGGDSNSRYNWEHGDAASTAVHWFFRNVSAGHPGGSAWRRFLEENQAHGVGSVLTLPMIGWVAKDTHSYGFPVSQCGPQQQTAPGLPEAGNGLRPSGEPVPPERVDPERTSQPAPPEFIGRWVRTIKDMEARRGERLVRMYILDNEPMLWNHTHRDVHPAPVSYAELLERTVRYGRAVREADPEALIAGPALWGWQAYLYSAVDEVAGFEQKPDRLAHGDEPLLPWYLRRLREYEERTGQRLLDVVDVHFYPEGGRLGVGPRGDTDPETAARRIASTRSLWDPTFKGEPWLDEPLQLFPRLKRWVAESYPGRELSLGEYGFGAEGHISGGLAQAEALGRFAEAGLYSAFYWTFPEEGSAVWWAFRAYRNFDGEGGRFQDWWVPARAPPGLSAFASRDARGRQLVVVVLNLQPEQEARVVLDAPGCRPVLRARRYSYAGGSEGLVPAELEPGQGVRATLPPYSLSVFHLELREG